MSKIEVDAIDKQSGSTLTLGGSGTAVTLACGATQSGFGRTGTVDWQTTIKTGDFTASNGEGYFVNTTSGEVDVTLPAGSAGSIVSVADYANTADTNNIILKQNGSDKIEGSTDDFIINVEGAAVTLVFADSTKGWIVTAAGNSSDSSQALFVTATGGTITTDGDFKIHTFTGPGTFCVSSAGNSVGSNTVDSLVIAGGGAGGMGQGGGGGGAGGYRESFPNPATGGLTICAQAYPITVGAGGAGQVRPNGDPYPAPGPSGAGANSIFSSITSAGGGMGGAGAGNCQQPGFAGGSGGGGGGRSPLGNPGVANSGGSGNTPPVSPPQGNPGGASNNIAPSCTAYDNGGGGGGAGGTGPNSGTGPGANAGPGGIGATSSITGSPVVRGGGGGGGACNPGTLAGTGGPGGGANGKVGAGSGSDAPVNLGGGGGGNGSDSGQGARSGNGGSGIVIIRYKFQ